MDGTRDYRSHDGYGFLAGGTTLPRRRIAPTTVLWGAALVILLVALLQTAGGQTVSALFFTGDNVRFVIAQAAITAIAAMGMAVIVNCAGIDLGAQATLLLSSTLAAVLLRGDFGSAAALFLAVSTGGFVGLVNGVLVSMTKQPPWLLSLAVAGVSFGIARWQAGGSTVPLAPGWLDYLMPPVLSTPWMVVAPGVWVVILAAGLLGIMMNSLALGRQIVAVGSNPVASQFYGVSVGSTRSIAYLVGGVCFGLAGVLNLAWARQVNPVVDMSLLPNVLLAIYLGGGSLAGNRANLIGTGLGVLVITALHNALQNGGFSPEMPVLVTSALLLLAVCLDRRDTQK
jgi:ribose/xylose/arabinose/galactoside ABC-type transport system permease subunit